MTWTASQREAAELVWAQTRVAANTAAGAFALVTQQAPPAAQRLQRAAGGAGANFAAVGAELSRLPDELPETEFQAARALDVARRFRRRLDLANRAISASPLATAADRELLRAAGWTDAVAIINSAPWSRLPPASTQTTTEPSRDPLATPAPAPAPSSRRDSGGGGLVLLLLLGALALMSKK